MSLVWRSIRTPLPNGRVHFGGRKVGGGSDEMVGLAAGVSLAAQGHLIRVYISNLEQYPGAFVSPTGQHNFDPIPGDLDASAFVDGVEIPLPDLLLNPPAGMAYRLLFGASAAGLVPGASDGTLLRVSAATAGGRPVAVAENGTFTVG